jgi:hypothetical protein
LGGGRDDDVQVGGEEAGGADGVKSGVVWDTAVHVELGWASERGGGFGGAIAGERGQVGCDFVDRGCGGGIFSW